jgi:uncharacterized radical SAM superfamily Fe-S cluster-containing enzyme
MLDEIKKIQGINHTEFDTIITNYIDSAKADLKGIGIVDTLIKNNSSLIHTAIITYVLSHLDVDNSKMYVDSYNHLKDELRHTSEYIVEGLLEEESTEDNINAVQ